MVVGLKADFFWYSIGEPDFLHSFFSSVCINLENGRWGEKFPIVMKNLYSGQLAVEQISQASVELEQIEREFQVLSPDKVIWDANDLSKTPPWGDNISTDVKNLYDYYLTSSGDNIFTTFKNAFRDGLKENVPIEILNL